MFSSIQSVIIPALCRRGQRFHQLFLSFLSNQGIPRVDVVLELQPVLRPVGWVILTFDVVSVPVRWPVEDQPVPLFNQQRLYSVQHQ
jgi:hypothetical protein